MGTSHPCRFTGYIIFVLLFLGLAAVPRTQSQTMGEDEVSARELIEKAEETEKIQEEKEITEADKIESGATPLDTLLDLRRAVEVGDWKAAAAYLDTHRLPQGVRSIPDTDLIWMLRNVFAQQNIVDLGKISDDPGGDPNDGFPGYRDKVGLVTLSSGKVPIYLQRVVNQDGSRVWKVANITVARIPEMAEELGQGSVARFLRDALPGFHVMGMENWQLLAAVIFVIFAWWLSVLVTYVVMRLTVKFDPGSSSSIQRFFKRPARFFLFIMTTRFLLDELGLSLTTRVLLKSSGLGYIAWLILVLGILALVRDHEIRRLQAAGNAHYISLIRPFTTIVQVFAATIIFLLWTDTAGYNMSTLLAGLGVGSLAVALAAQKTLENVFGAIILYAAKPVTIGEFCRFGTNMGVVEEIGLRSTLIRTLDRTVLAIPNAVFSSMEIENYSRRDCSRFYRNLSVKVESDEVMRYLLAEVRRILLAHPLLMQETVSARLENIEEANCIIRLEARVDTNDFMEYLEVVEDLNLRIIKIVSGSRRRIQWPRKSDPVGEYARQRYAID